MRNPICHIIGALLIFSATTLLAQRLSENLSSNWKFIKQDVDLGSNTTDWQNITVPHTWNAQDGQLGKVGNPGLNEGYYRGVCWYALSLDIPPEWKNRRIFIRFEAASLVSKTYLNGEFIGEHRGGFTAFCYELTPYIYYGETNDLRVQVDNSHQEDVPPLSGDFNIDGGLYRPVQLIVTDQDCISPLDFASPGVYLTTTSLNSNSATLEIKSIISNGLNSAAKLTIKSSITDAKGNQVGTLSSDQLIDANKAEPFTQNLTISNPHRWNGVKDPYLYSVTVQIIRDGNAVDQVVQPLGLRTFSISHDQGFLLNDEPYPIHGVNRHQDYLDRGWALTSANQDEDAQIILDMGATAIRLTHYPQSDYFHGLCDKNGLLLWDEVSMVNTIRDTPEFKSNAELQLRELILQLYNHPSVAFWGTFNELENQKTPRADDILQHLKDVIHELDPYRIDVGASDHFPRSYNKIPTAICFNGYPGWYGHGTPEDMAKYIDDRENEVGKRIGLSEYGGGGNPFQHEEGSPKKSEKGGFHPEEWQSYIHECEWRIIQNNPKVWGSFIWCMFDFPSAHRNEGGHPGLNDKGMVTQDRKVKKDAYYFYKANWNATPMVYIASRRSTSRTIASTEVKVYSNCPEIELIVNGQSQGRINPDEVKIARWPNVILRPGQNHIEAVASSSSNKLTDSCDWTLASTNTGVDFAK